RCPMPSRREPAADSEEHRYPLFTEGREGGRLVWRARFRESAGWFLVPEGSPPQRPSGGAPTDDTAAPGRDEPARAAPPHGAAAPPGVGGGPGDVVLGGPQAGFIGVLEIQPRGRSDELSRRSPRRSRRSDRAPRRGRRRRRAPARGHRVAARAGGPRGRGAG